MIEQSEYARLLGYPRGHDLEGEALRLAGDAEAWYRRHGSPRVTTSITGDGVVAGFTAGTEVDARIERLWEEGRVDEAYFLDRLAAGVVERLAVEMGRELGAVHRSPGTTGYPMEAQWTLMRALESLEPGIELLASGALRPKHSLLALYVSGDASASPCSRCGLPCCDFRRIA